MRGRLMVAAAAAAVVVAGAVAFAVAGGNPPESVRWTGPFVDPTEAATSVTGGGASADLAAARRAARDITPLGRQDAVRELRGRTGQPNTLDLDLAGRVTLVAAPAGQSLVQAPGAPATTDATAAASAFVNRYGQGFGLRAGQQAAVTRVSRLPGGATTVRLQQRAGGVPVLGGELTVTVDQTGHVVVATAATPAEAPIATAASVPASQVVQTARTAAAARLGIDTADAARLAITSTKLWLYDARMINAAGRAELRPTWWVSLGWTDRAGKAATVLVDAVDGTLSLAVSEVETAKNRIICDLQNVKVDLTNQTTYDCSDAAGGPAVVRREGGAVAAVADVNQAYDMLGGVYDFYRNAFGRDSIDGKGMPLAATVRACDRYYTCPFKNAFWDGSQMVFGQGYAAADDVVAHELTHGVTDFTSELFYFSQSGAINESLSDIFGELFDQSRGSDNDNAWYLGEDLPGGPIRSMSNPTALFQPDHVRDLESPDPVSDSYWNDGFGDYGDAYGVHTLSGVPNKAAYLIGHGGLLRGTTVTGIGNAKSAQIWYRAQFLLPSGAQFVTLASVLPAACRSILGVAGITAADCVQVDKAVLATNLGSTENDPYEIAKCASPGQPVRTLFKDSFEPGSRSWSLATSWQRIPSGAVPVSWSSSGRAALYSWVPEGSAGAIAKMPKPVHIPAGTTYVWFATNTPTGQGGGRLVYWSAAGGGYAYVTNATGLNASGTLGYDSVRYDVSALAGQDVYLGLLANNAPAQNYNGYDDGSEWLVDDFAVYQCLDQAGSPQAVAAQLAADRLSLDVSWTAPIFAGPGIAGYEIFVAPEPSGVALPITVAAGTTSLHLDGLDPDTRYTIAVRTVGSGGTVSVAIEVPAPTDPLIDCTTLPARDDRSGCAGTPVPAPGGRSGGTEPIPG